MGLRLLRGMFGIACSLLSPFSAKYRWLGHYLWGRGNNLPFPTELIDWDAIGYAVVTQREGTSEGRYRLKHYSLDMKNGLLSQFLGGNEMFYVLATVEFSVSMDQFDKEFLIQGMDLYWWHPNPDGTWPIGIRFGGGLGRLLRWLAPKDKRDAWFPFDAKGGCGISNEFWADTVEAGAKPFYTIMAANKTREEWQAVLDQAEASRAISS